MAIKLINQFTVGVDEKSYAENDLVKSAVERQYLIIGEALSRIRKDDLVVFMQVTDGQKIVGFRNVLAHGYDAVDDAVSWDIIKNKLPMLSSDIQRLISKVAAR